MIQVLESQSAIVVAGHSRYAPPGQDIVCAAVSALVQTLALSLNRWVPGQVKCFVDSGIAIFHYPFLNEKSRILIRSFLLGMEAIAKEYPGNIVLTRRGSQ